MADAQPEQAASPDWQYAPDFRRGCYRPACTQRGVFQTLSAADRRLRPDTGARLPAALIVDATVPGIAILFERNRRVTLAHNHAQQLVDALQNAEKRSPMAS